MRKIITENYSHSYKKLEKTKSIEEILTIAISFEKTACDFYRALIPNVNDNILVLVKELAEEEQHHYDLFCALRDSSDVQKQLKNRIKTPQGNTAFSQFTQPVELGDNPDDKTLLLYAIAREDAAMKHYRDLAENAPDGGLKETFQFLAFEEAEHKLELEQKYQDLFTD